MTGFSGIWPALVTPFTADNEVHTDTVVRLVEYHLEKGVGGFYVCGSTGSGVYLSVAERKLMLETVMHTVAGQVPIIAHVGAVSVADAVELACHAQAQGAAGFSSIIPPLYPTLEVVFAYYEALARAAPNLAFFPYLVRPDSSSLALVQRLQDLPNLRGAKYTGPNMYEFGQIAALRDDNWYVFAGMDEQCIFAAMSGACGHIGSTMNVMPGAYITIRKRLVEGDHDAAMTLQQRANAVTQVIHTVNFGGGLYAMLERMGLDCGNPRLPSVPLSDDEKQRYYAALDAAGMWDMVEMT